MRTMHGIVRFKGAITAFIALSLTGIVAGCSSNDVPHPPRPTTSQSTMTHMPRPIVVTKTASPAIGDACGSDDAPMTLVRVDGQFRCLRPDEVRVYEKTLQDQARALLRPIEMSLGAGASPEAVLRAVVALSCKQTLDNPYYWDHAQQIYRSIILRTNRDALATKWPVDFRLALKVGCY